MHFHVAGAFKLFINQVVHTAAGVYQAGSQDSQTAAFRGITGRTEEAFGRMQCRRIDTAGEGSAAGRHCQVIGTGQTGNTVQQDDHIHATFHDAFGSFQGEFCHAGMVFYGFIKSSCDDFALNGTPHIGNLFRTLTDKANHQVNITVIGCNGISDGFQQHCFTGFGR